MRRAKPSQWPVSSMNEEIMNPSWNENSGELAERGCKFSAVCILYKLGATIRLAVVLLIYPCGYMRRVLLGPPGKGGEHHELCDIYGFIRLCHVCCVCCCPVFGQ